VNGEGREVDEVTDVGVPAYWLWVTGPQYYLGSDGSDRVDLEPADEYVPDGWWTCHRDTRKGDLIMLYRKKPKMDIAYLFQARSNASSLLHDTSAEPGWKYGCDYDVIEKFKNPMGIAEIKADSVLEDWNAKNSRFQRSAFRTSWQIWAHLFARLVENPEKTKVRIWEAESKAKTEAEIERELINHPERFQNAKMSLSFERSQLVCMYGGRADLLYLNKRTQGYVVVELKCGAITRNAVGQVLSYRASIEDSVEFRAAKPPLGVLVGTSIHNEAAGMVKNDPRLRFISLNELGL